MKRWTRAEVPQAMTWNLSDLFASVEGWEQELKQIQADLVTVSQFKGRLHEGAGLLLACLNAEEMLQERVVRATTYANLRSSEDGSDPVNQANWGKVNAMLASVSAGLAFIDSEVLELPEATIQRYLDEETELAVFSKKLFELLETKPHRLHSETETALATLGELFSSPYLTYQRAKTSDMEFAPIQDAKGGELAVSFSLYEDHYEFLPDVDLRRKAYQSFVGTLHQYKNTMATTFGTEVKKQVTMARLRKYESTTDMLLQPQQVSPKLYHNILDVIQSELAPHMRRYAKLKQKVLGLDKMMYCDLKVPLDFSYNPQTSFQEGADLILDALSVMGEEYTTVIEQALRERWIDYADNIGKSTGAFCSSPYGAHPFILITWTDTMRSAFVLAHELGHAGHFALAQRNQRLVNTRPSMSFIEAPSTMNEQLLGNHILAKSNDPRMRRWVLTQFLGTYYHNFVTHLLEGEFQRRIYNLAEAGRPITAQLLTSEKADVLTRFWGNAVEIDEDAGLTWMRQPHYYMGLYPYTYSVGLTVSTAVAQHIRAEGQAAVDRWLRVLKAGGTEKPMELMRMAGVDMASPQPIQSAVAYVGSLVDELEQSFL